MPQTESVNHYHQFADAVLGIGKTSTPFDYAGPLTESVLLGPVATHFPQTTLEWNAAKLKFTNSAEASQYVRRAYRAGWKVRASAECCDVSWRCSLLRQACLPKARPSSSNNPKSPCLPTPNHRKIGSALS